MDCNELNVDEGAFWHTNMDLYYGYKQGEVVEVEHESNKYWLASIEYCFKNLILMKWVGDYGEFWIDSSAQNSATNSSSTLFNQSNNTPKRFFPLGQHSINDSKGQFKLEKPTKVLTKPSFYDPAKDPYANIKTVDDLLAYEAENANDTLMNANSLTAVEPSCLVIAKCKTKISYGQEDVEELEAALQNLGHIDPDQNEQRNDESPDDFNLAKSGNNDLKVEKIPIEDTCDIKSESNEDSGVPSSQSDSSKSNHDELMTISTSSEQNPASSGDKKDTGKSLVDATIEQDEINLKICEKLLEDVSTRGEYCGLGKYSSEVFQSKKPRQFYDLGGANHERVITPGTILVICYTIEEESGPRLTYWFATVIKNVGGRLTLRWLLCDSPKFKQGRLDLKSIKSKYVFEDIDAESTEVPIDDEKIASLSKDKIPFKDVTFCLHFCNPCVQSLETDRIRNFRLPTFIRSFIENLNDSNTVKQIEEDHINHVFDPKRINLDKDRPMIDHILATAQAMRPKYIDIKLGSSSNELRNVLLSCPKLTRVFKGFIKQEPEEGVYEVHSEALSDSGDSIKYFYPYDNSHTILPMDWALNNVDCLSVQPSRNPSPSLIEKVTNEEAVLEDDKSEAPESVDVNTISIPESTPIVEDKTDETLINSENPTRSQGPSSEVVPEQQSTSFECRLDLTSAEFVSSKFHIMQQLEVVHPSSNATICAGRIRKIAYPLLWIQISSDSYTLLPFNSTDIYPTGWCQEHDHPLMSLLPPRKRITNDSSQDKKRKKAKFLDTRDPDETSGQASPEEYEIEDFNFDLVGPLDSDYILSEKTALTQIYFNHKCFTGPSLSKGKICALPQYVGPGPLRLVMEEVMTKVISVAYVPPRILNDLSSDSFRDLLVARNMTNTVLMEFKAKYQKRVHRERVPICINSNDVARYCECVCEHLKCCYNLFGPNLYDGDDCPGHCRALTKSNKFMKRATYYRDKARNGEFVGDNSASNKKQSQGSNSKTSRARYAGRGSSESTTSTVSRSELVNSRASSVGDENPQGNDLKENLQSVKEGENEEVANDDTAEAKVDVKVEKCDGEVPYVKATTNLDEDAPLKCARQYDKYSNQEAEFNIIDSPEEWTVELVVEHLKYNGLSKFEPQMISEAIDGQALLLLDKAAIREHFLNQPKMDYTLEEVGKLYRFVECVKSQV